MVEEGLKEAGRHRISKALILAAPTTIRLKLYEQSAIKCAYPLEREQETINQFIRNISAGKIEKSEAQQLKEMIEHMHARESFDGIVLACTELPLLQEQLPLSDRLPVIDTIKTLAKQLVERAR